MTFTPNPANPLATPDGHMPQWQRNYIDMLLKGYSEAAARKICGVSPATIQVNLQRDARFARACVDAAMNAGTVELDVPTVKKQALRYAPEVLADAFEESKDAAQPAAARLGNRKLIIDASGINERDQVISTGPQLTQIIVNVVDRETVLARQAALAKAKVIEGEKAS